ncbi:MAG: SprT-like domain-containing protein [Cyclobacteriaceae bacterium]|nr:SprT-like domain-containing protein [Cyclobacteriaceae bacterium]
MMKEKFKAILSKYVPENSVGYCVDLWDQHRFSFKVSRERRSKLGDYQFHKARRQHIITINGSLNRYGFLITFIHEAAHMIHFELRGNNHRPHGIFWKKVFRELMNPLLNQDIFPHDLLEQLKIHMKNPKASSYSDPALARLIKKYDPDRSYSEFFLEELTAGEKFRFHGRTYEKVESRRTRCLCREVNSGKKYLISEMAMVRKL